MINISEVSLRIFSSYDLFGNLKYIPHTICSFSRVHERPGELSPSARVSRKEHQRIERRESNRSLLLNSWHTINMKTYQYDFNRLPPDLPFATLMFRKSSLLNVFLRFVTPSLVEGIMAPVPTERWVRSAKNRHSIPDKVSDIYKYMANYILRQGNQGYRCRFNRK